MYLWWPEEFVSCKPPHFRVAPLQRATRGGLVAYVIKSKMPNRSNCNPQKARGVPYASDATYVYACLWCARWCPALSLNALLSTTLLHTVRLRHNSPIYVQRIKMYNEKARSLRAAFKSGSACAFSTPPLIRNRTKQHQALVLLRINCERPPSLLLGANYCCLLHRPAGAS